MRLEYPLFLLLILFIPIYLFLKYRGFNHFKVKLEPSILFSSKKLFQKKQSVLTKYYDWFSDGLICLSLIFLIFALARPQGGKAITLDKLYSVDIVLSIDVSGSMLYVDTIPDFLPYRNVMGTRVYIDEQKKLIEMNRLNSAKRVIKDYINKQEYNRIGLVVFAGYSYTMTPLTIDKKMLLETIDSIDFQTDNDGTAIGMGISTAINRLRKSDSKSKVIILLTDGVNNAGMVAPLTAANIAKELGIKIYTIGLGNPTGFLTPVTLDMDQFVLQSGVSIDEPLLKEIASLTGGKFYKAEDSEALKKVYDDIDQLEKTKIEIKRRVLYSELFYPFLVIGFIFLLAYILFTHLIIKLP